MSKLTMILAAYAGNEELEAAGIIEEAVTEAAEEAVKVEIAEVTAELEEVKAEVTELTDIVEELGDAQEELEETVEGMESLLASGNFSSGAFTHMYKRAGKLNAKLGGEVPVLGAESFSDASSAQLNARDGMEAFGETAKGWATQAIAFIKNLFNRMITFVVGLLNKGKGLDKRVKFLEAKIKESGVKEKVKLGGWNALLDITGEKNIVIKGTVVDTGKLFGTGLAAKIENAVKTGSADSAISDFSTGYKGLTSQLSVGKEVTGSDKDTVGRMAAVGAFRLMFSFYKDSISNVEEAVKALKALKFSVSKDSEAAKKLASGNEESALSASEVNQILANVKSTVTSVEKEKLTDVFSASRRDKVIGLLNVATKDVENKDGVKKAAGFVRQYCTTSSGFLTAYSNARLKFAGIQLECVSAHAK